MTVLLALSILALAALLWATISIAGFVRRQRRRRSRRAADAATVIATATPPTAAPVQSAVSSLPTPAAELGPPPPPRLRSFPTRLGKQPASTAPADPTRPPWNPFRKDLADLSDPVASRHVPAPRPRNKKLR